MKNVWQDYASSIQNTAGNLVTAAGQPVPVAVQEIAAAFVALQQARHQADYDIGATITQGQADTDVMRAEVAFLDWSTIRIDPAAATFLIELLCRGIPRR